MQTKKTGYIKPDFKKKKLRINLFYRPGPQGNLLAVGCTCAVCGYGCPGGCSC